MIYTYEELSKEKEEGKKLDWENISRDQLANLFIVENIPTSLIAELYGRYTVTSNRESGFGRYDVMIEPKDKENDAIILEFKVHDPEEEHSLEDTVAVALKQIEEKQYFAILKERGFAEEKIRKYGFAFEGKNVLIG